MVVWPESIISPNTSVTWPSAQVIGTGLRTL